jgi:hypothetical protein
MAYVRAGSSNRKELEAIDVITDGKAMWWGIGDRRNQGSVFFFKNI